MFGVDQEDNELITLELIHGFVEILDAYFGNVCVHISWYRAG
jgi:AP-1 complex subunit sigma 1/2